MTPAESAIRKIVLVSSSLGGGGAERVLLTMGQHWCRMGWSVTIVTLRSDRLSEYAVPAGIRVERLGLIGENNPFWRPSHAFRLWALRRTLIRLGPDVVISFIDKLNAAVLLALVGTGIPVVATEHLAPWMTPLGLAWSQLRRATYRRARAVVTPTVAITDWFKNAMPGRFETLPYPARTYVADGEVLRRNVLLGVGRLSPQKGFDLLISAFAKIADRFPDWNLEIAGEGPERSVLEKQIKTAGLGGRVALLGQVADIGALYQRSEVFALSSRHEAYPMALCEALSAGCCVVAFDCPTGPREILGGSGAGILVPPENTAMFAAELGSLLASSEIRNRMRSAALGRAKELAPEAVMTAWCAAITRWVDVGV